jgi:hypothetical protein
MDDEWRSAARCALWPILCEPAWPFSTGRGNNQRIDRAARLSASLKPVIFCSNPVT